MVDAKTIAMNPSMLGGTRSVIGRSTSRSVQRLSQKVQEEFEAIDARDNKAKALREAAIPSAPLIQEAPESPDVPGFFMARALGKSGKLAKPDGENAEDSPSKTQALKRSKTQRELLLDKKRFDSPSGQATRAALGIPVTTSPSATASPFAVSDEKMFSAHLSNSMSDPEIRLRSSSDVGPASPAKSIKMSSSFTSQGKDGPQFGEKSSRHLRRFFYLKGDEGGPEGGRYQVESSLVAARLQSWDFREREVHPSRKKAFTGCDDTGNWIVSAPSSCTPDPDMFSRSLQRNTSTGNSLSETAPPILEHMKLHSQRPDSLAWSMRDGSLKMTDLQTRPEDLGDHDLNMSHAHRIPTYNFCKPQGRSDPSKKSHFEAGKYKVARADPVVRASIKAGLEFERHLHRNQSGPGGHWQPPEILAHDSPLKSVSLDRSLYRGTALSGSQHMPRTLCVREFDGYLDRPPIIKKVAAMYDEHDPEVVAAVHGHIMQYDADTSDIAVTVRRDVAPNMCNALARQRGDIGQRMFQENAGMRGSKGMSFQDTSVSLHSAVEDSKEDPSRPRRDCGLRQFDRVKGRASGEPPVPQSQLRRPRRAAAPEFQRKAALQGFTTAAGLGGPLKANRRRAHETPPSDWIIEDPGFAENDSTTEKEAGDCLGQLVSESA